MYCARGLRGPWSVVRVAIVLRVRVRAVVRVCACFFLAVRGRILLPQLREQLA